MRRLTVTLALAASLLGGCDSSDAPKSAHTAGDTRALAGAPKPLAALHAEANELLDGGKAGFAKRLRALRGFPVVVNKWASWCGPCRQEFPYFQRQALKRGRSVAFLGVNSSDNDGDAARFLEEFPVSFPSYKDPDQALSSSFKAVAFPATAYYDREGELAYVHQGVYLDEKRLATDIERYAR